MWYEEKIPAMTDHADLEISLHHTSADTYRVELRFTDPQSGADARHTGQAQFDLDRLRQMTLDSAAYGRSLIENLFADPTIREKFAHARGIAGTRPLRLRLAIGESASNLHTLRWETLHDPESGNLLLTSEHVLFSRYLSGTDWRPVALRPRAALRALIVVANPTDLDGYAPDGSSLTPLDVAGELARAREGLGDMALTELASGGAATLNAIAEHLRDGYDILYLVAHGAFIQGTPFLWLEKCDGTADVVNGDDLVTRVRECQHKPRLVVLASCQSGVGDRRSGIRDRGTLDSRLSTLDLSLGPALAEAGVPAVLAMQGNLTMKTAAAFLPVFFREVQRDGCIDRAMAVARGTVRDRPDWWVPVLLLRLREGRLWQEEPFFDSEEMASIEPLKELPVSDERQSMLKTEFYQGMKARYEHICANLDFRRDDKLAQIREAFHHCQVVIISAASGQGKSTLAYRYLHENYQPEKRFFIADMQEQSEIIRAAKKFSEQAQRTQQPLALYIDVQSRDVDHWPELVSRLVRLSQVHVLVTIRAEDFYRSIIPAAEFHMQTMELAFDENEARVIYEQANKVQQIQSFLDFGEAWDRFRSQGPLLEFVYLLTQTTTLEQRLEEQVNRLRRNRTPDERRLLRLIAVASAYEARLMIPALVQKLNLPDPQETLKAFEKEYLIRRSPDEGSIEGLHPVRSGILTKLLTESIVEPWIKTAREALPLMAEQDIEGFLLHALVEYPDEREPLLQAMEHLALQSWVGLLGVLRVFLWADIQSYIDVNAAVIREARDEFPQAWWLVVDLNIADLTSTLTNDLWDLIRVPEERRQKIQAYRDQQTPKENVFQRTRMWLRTLTQVPIVPSSNLDWSSAAEFCFKAAKMGHISHFHAWLTDEGLSQAVDTLSLSTLANVSLALYTCDEQRHASWIATHTPLLEQKLAQEYNILFLEKREQTLYIHFLPTVLTRNSDEDQEQGSDHQPGSDELHEETMERIRLARNLFPGYERYGSQGYGYAMGLPEQIEELNKNRTRKDAIKISNLPHPWVFTVNTIAQKLAAYPYRPENWDEYVDLVIKKRRFVLKNLSKLIKGIKDYFRRKSTRLLGGIIAPSQWDSCRLMLELDALLPKCAVDQWGFAGERWDKANSLEQEPFVSQAIATQKYRRYIQSERDYFSSLSRFITQSLHIIVVNFQVQGKRPPNPTEVLTALRERGIRTDVGHYTTYALTEARNHLPLYQQQFRVLFGNIARHEPLEELERDEKDILDQVWSLWFFYANQPDLNVKKEPPVAYIQNQIKVTRQRLRGLFRQALDTMSARGTSAIMLPQTPPWDGKPTLWIRLDIDNPLEYYERVEDVINTLREVFGTIAPVPFQDITYYVIRGEFEYIAIVPLVRGRMIDPLAWHIDLSFTILSEEGIEQKPWHFIPKVIPNELWKDLEISLWQKEEVQQANQFAELVQVGYMLISLLADLKNIPDMTEDGFNILQRYSNQQASLVSSILQQIYHTLASIANEFQALAKEEREQRLFIQEAIGYLMELHELITLGENSDDEQRFTLEQMPEYAQRFGQARSLAHRIKLLWIADVLDRESVA
jgi:hypothetical protein